MPRIPYKNLAQSDEMAEKLEQLRALEHGVAIGVILVKQGSVGVDTPEDVAKAECLLR